MKSPNHRESFTAELGSIRGKSVLHQVYLSQQDRIVALKNADLNSYGPYRSVRSCERRLSHLMPVGVLQCHEGDQWRD